MIINHVLSSAVHSAIFSAIFDYFEQFAPDGAKVVVSVEPVMGASIYHYHRPHLEHELKPNSVATVHHDLFDPDPWLEWNKFAPRYREASRIVCLNRGQQSFLNKAGLSHTTVIPHGYNDQVLRVRSTEIAQSEKISLGILSKYYERRFKGEAYLHDMVKHLSPEKFRFTLVGEQRLITAEYLLELGFEVRLFEYLPYRLFQSLYESIDYLLMCSNFEGGPANLPEAMATATPLIATAVGMVPDFIRDGDNGIILSGEPIADANKLTTLSLRGEYAQAVINGARRLVASVPTWRDVVLKYFALYSDVLQRT